MHLTTLSAAALIASSLAYAQTSSEAPGYNCMPTCIESTVPANQTLSFGKHYAVLNLDYINGLAGGLVNTTAGEAWLSNTGTWIDAVHAQNPPPLSIYTRIYFSASTKPEIGPNAPFVSVGGDLGTIDDPLTELVSAVQSRVDQSLNDVVIPKTRYYAGAGNALEEILNTQEIDTVVLSGIRTSGVVISTAYRLFDLDYNVYVIANNTIEVPPNTPDINGNILNGILPKVPIDVITIEQALAALNQSGPAVYGMGM